MCNNGAEDDDVDHHNRVASCHDITGIKPDPFYYQGGGGHKAQKLPEVIIIMAHSHIYKYKVGKRRVSNL